MLNVGHLIERNAGELLAGMEKQSGARGNATPPRLDDMGITKTQSSRWQRTKLALRLEETIKERAKANQSMSEGRGVKGPQISANLNHIETREEIAKLAGVSRDTVDKVTRRDWNGGNRWRDGGCTAETGETVLTLCLN